MLGCEARCITSSTPTALLARLIDLAGTVSLCIARRMEVALLSASKLNIILIASGNFSMLTLSQLISLEHLALYITAAQPLAMGAPSWKSFKLHAWSSLTDVRSLLLTTSPVLPTARRISQQICSTSCSLEMIPDPEARLTPSRARKGAELPSLSS